jgi:acetolactate synthase-1/2/3 large subunit
MSYAHAVVARLAHHGVETVFAIPGTHNLELFRALSAHGISIVPAHHEQGLGYAADAYSRVTGRPAVVLTTTGPGITNLITALATSAAASVPVLAIAPGLPDEALGGGAGWLHELPDQLGLMRQVVRAHRAASSSDAVGFIDRCVEAWATERPLPAYLELPLDVLAGPADAEPGAAAAPPETTAPRDRAERAGDADGIRAAGELLAAAERPLIVAGRGACGPLAATLLRRIAEALRAPVLTTANAKGVLDERHLACGVALRTAAAARMISESDGVLVVGSDLGSSEFWGRPGIRGDQLVRVDVDARGLRANVDPAIPLLGRAEEVLEALSSRLDSRTVDAAQSPEEPRHWAERHAGDIRAELAADGAPYAGFHTVMQEELGGLDVAVTGDSSQASYFGTASFWTSDRPNRFLYPAGFGTLGYAVPAAIGAAIGGEADRVLAITGEGGLLFSVQELATVSELGLPLITVVFVNGGYQEILEGMQERGIRPAGVAFESPDFAALAAAFRMHAESVVADRGAEDAFRDALRRAIALDRPALIEVRL